MIFKFLIIVLATFLTCSFYFIAAYTALQALTVKVKNDDRRRPR